MNYNKCCCNLFPRSSRNEVILETTEGLVINEALVLQGYAISKVLLQAANKDEVSCEGKVR